MLAPARAAVRVRFHPTVSPLTSSAPRSRAFAAVGLLPQTVSLENNSQVIPSPPAADGAAANSPETLPNGNRGLAEIVLHGSVLPAVHSSRIFTRTSVRYTSELPRR